MESSSDLLRGPGAAALLTLDGEIVDLNGAMAQALGRSAERCVGAGFSDLWPAGQQIAAGSLVAHAAADTAPSMKVLDFPGSGNVSSASLIELMEARQVKDLLGNRDGVWVHALDTHNDLASLLIPFRMAAIAAGLGLWMFSVSDSSLEWLGGKPSLGALFPFPTMPLDEVTASVHPDDRDALLRLMRTTSAQSDWKDVRYRPDNDDWHQLAVQMRRVQLGNAGPQLTFGVVRDDTKEVRSKARRKAALVAERQRAQEISDFSCALITAATEQELVQVVLTRLAAAFGAAGALLALVEDDTLRISTDAGIAMQEVAVLDGMPLDDPSPLPEAIHTGRPHVIADRGDYTRRWPHAVELPRLSRLGPDYAFAITPLSEAGNPPLGGFLVTCKTGHLPSVEDRALMSTLADLAGQALRRIRLQEAQVQLAVKLQEVMLPSLPEHIAGLEVAARYRPSGQALEIGGDWYDAFVMPDGAVAMEIGDVQGHDVEAAAFMGQVQLSMRAIADHERDPSRVVARTNQLLTTLDRPRFASCTMLRIDPNDGRVTGTTAGHVPLVHARKDGSYTVHELPGGPVLGVLPDTEYPEETFTLDRDSALIMVTDGVVEGPGLALDAGLSRVGALAGAALHDGLDAEQTADRVLDAARSVDHDDDLTVLVVRRT